MNIHFQVQNINIENTTKHRVSYLINDPYHHIIGPLLGYHFEQELLLRILVGLPG